MSVVILAALGVFAYFASVVVNFPGEVGVSTWMQSWRAPWIDNLMKVISLPGILVVAVPMVILTSLALYLKGWRAESLLVLATAVGGRLIAIGLKEAVERPRPHDGLVQVLQEVDGYSFPSGHVMHYAVFFGILAVIAATRIGPGRGRNLTYGALALLLAAIGISRIYLGVHQLGDVVAGYAFGALVVAGAAWLWFRWQARAGKITPA